MALRDMNAETALHGVHKYLQRLLLPPACRDAQTGGSEWAAFVTTLRAPGGPMEALFEARRARMHREEHAIRMQSRAVRDRVHIALLTRLFLRAPGLPPIDYIRSNEITRAQPDAIRVGLHFVDLRVSGEVQRFALQAYVIGPHRSGYRNEETFNRLLLPPLPRAPPWSLAALAASALAKAALNATPSSFRNITEALWSPHRMLPPASRKRQRPVLD
jgi:hypothetical protein